jgi:hypothetical protein
MPTILIKRTEAGGPPPALSLAAGELAVELATPIAPRLWIGVPPAVDPSGQRVLADNGAYLPLTGGTLTGPLTAPAINVNGAAGINRTMIAMTNGSPRWTFGADAAAETGTNAGSNFLIGYHDDAGAWVGSAFSISRTGASTFRGPVTLFADPTVALHAATKQYVDAVAGSGGAYLPLTGGTLTGPLQVPELNVPNTFAVNVSAPGTIWCGVPMTAVAISSNSTITANAIRANNPAANTVGAIVLGLQGDVFGTRFFFDATGSTIEGVDSTLTGSTQSLRLSGTQVLAPTPATGDNSTKIATTAFVKAQGYATGGPFLPLAGGTLTAPGNLTLPGIVTATGQGRFIAAGGGNPGVTFNNTGSDPNYAISAGGAPCYLHFGLADLTTNLPTTHLLRLDGTGNLTLLGAGAQLTLMANPTAALHAAPKQYVDTKAPLASPTFTGVPAAPTAAAATNTTQLATTAFVKAQGYVTGGPYLPLTGGTLTGALSVNSLLQTTGDFIFNGTTADILAVNNQAITIAGAGGGPAGSISLNSAATIVLSGAAGIDLRGDVYGTQCQGPLYCNSDLILNHGTITRAGNSSITFQQAAAGGALSDVFLLTDLFRAQTDNTRKIGTVNWYTPTDLRIEKNVIPYEQGLDVIRRLAPVSFSYNGLGGTPDDGRVYQGLVAQDTVEVMPEMFAEYSVKLHADDPEETPLYMTGYAPLPFALINAVKELAALVEEIDARLRTLEA